jgi:hypothetical protein|eukprot:COSAG01_NODE_737_length_13945_cov_10.858082_10_plen_56_part_00
MGAPKTIEGGKGLFWAVSRVHIKCPGPPELLRGRDVTLVYYTRILVPHTVVRVTR